MHLSAGQRALHAAALEFAEATVASRADAIDRSESFPPALMRELAAGGWLGLALPRDAGGGGADMLSYGLLHEALGRHCAATRALVNVHGMVAHAVHAFGTAAQRAEILPALAAGTRIGAFALTEPEAGSDAAAITTTATRRSDGWLLDGTKTWISFGQVADVVLVIARAPDGPTAFVVPGDAAGLTRTPISGMLGQRGSMLATLSLDGCRVDAAAVLGPLGGGLSRVAAAALDLGRYAIAWGSVGLAQACMDASVIHADARRQFGGRLRDLQLVQRMIARMVASCAAARLLCQQAGALRVAGDPRAVVETLVAKYFATTMLVELTADAVQIHGALGVSGERTVARHFRDAKVAEIVEGSTQVLEVLIARHALQTGGARRPAAAPPPAVIAS